MIDLHTHSLLSDGELLPSELARRARVRGYRAIGISDHADMSNMEEVIPALLRVARKTEYYEGITVVAGIEITHVPPRLIREMIRFARELGALYVVVHGETIAEPVVEGTNREAIEGGADILAHPGLIAEEEVRMAKERGVFLEISGRKGHSLTNGHVAGLARKVGAPLVFDTDAHAPGDLVSHEQALRIVQGSGLGEEDFRIMQRHAAALVERAMKRKP